MKIRFLSGIISAVFVLNIVGILPVNALAIDSETYVYEKEGYTVTYKVGSEWENNRSIEVTIENTGEESILNWALKYDVGGEVYNLWNSEVYESAEDYTIIKNNGYNYEIEAGQIADYGYIVTGEETLIPDDIELCSHRIDVKSGYTVDFNVTSDWYTGFNGEITINNTSDEPIEAWTLTVDGNYDITNVWNAKLLSQNEHTYEFANQLWTTPIKPGESAAFGFTADKSATLNAATENYRLTAVVVGDTTLDDIPAEEIDYELDSDSDCLPDYYEDILGTDKNNTDTDGDSLSDGYEVLYLGTDPLKADSDDNGINDGNEDFDSDGLTNAEESELGTDPNSADTDGDGLNDGAEKNVHGTDPLKFDSDEDGISDGDEITLGLNPSSSSTDGTPDNERTFAQTVGAESEVLSVINDDESVPFDVSLEIRAAGVAENNLSAYISGYSAVMQNDAVIGVIPEFSYSNGLTVEAVTIKFELDDSIINNTSGKYADNAELSGIRRLNIFKYFDDIDMLLPVETFCNENDNTVYCITDSLGTYCLMDMELWIESLTEENLSETEVNESNAASAYSDEMIKAEVKVSNAASNAPDDFTVVFVLDCRSEKTASEFALMKEEILDVSRAVFQRSPNAKIYLMKQSTSLTDGVNYSFVSNGSKNYFNDYDSIKTRIKSVLKRPVLNAVLSDAVEGVVTECNLSKHTFVFSIFDEENVFYRSKSGYEALDKAIAYNVDISVISNISDDKKYGYAHDMYNKTTGIYISDDAGYAEKVLEHIYGEAVSIPDDDNGEYNIILATGLRTAELDDTVSHIYADRFKSEAEQVDTDKDGLTDYKEINFGCNLIKFENGIVTLPTYGACVDYKSELTYVERGLNRFGDVIISDKSFLDYVYETVRVLPIVSDPTSEDGDGDGLLDGKALSLPISDTENNHNTKIIAPQDPNPLKTDGPDGVWRKHIEIQEKEVATEYNNKKYLASGNEWWKEAGTKIGAFVLRFSADDKEYAYHSDTTQWQELGGYNNIYDFVFKTATKNNMRREKFNFKTGTKCNDDFTVFDDNQKNDYEFIVWIWRGNYLNLGAGSEIGLYYRKTGSGGVSDHYKASKKLALPMTLELYNYNSSLKIDTIFAWAPEEPQWWITGFNPQYWGDVDVTKQVMIGSIDFSGHEKLYEGFARMYSENSDSHKFVILDDERKLVWICWCEEDLLR